jgi:predicted amidohydrolase
MRQLTANGAEVLVRVSAYMDPWGATEPMNWWTIVNRCRALENTAFVVAANQGASLRHYPPYSWPGGSQIVDFDGRVLAEASPVPASASSWRQSTSPPFATNARPGAGITCWRISGQRRIRSTRRRSTRPHREQRRMRRRCRSSGTSS